MLSYTVNAASAPYHQTLYATIIAVNNAGVQGAASTASAGTIVLDPAADEDGDGVSNSAEDLAGTNLFDPRSYLHVVATARDAQSGNVVVTWASVPGKNYVVQSSTNLATIPFSDLSGVLPGSAGTTTDYTDAGVGGAQKFYRVRVAVPPSSAPAIPSSTQRRMESADQSTARSR